MGVPRPPVPVLDEDGGPLWAIAVVAERIKIDAAIARFMGPSPLFSTNNIAVPQALRRRNRSRAGSLS